MRRSVRLSRWRASSPRRPLRNAAHSPGAAVTRPWKRPQHQHCQCRSIASSSSRPGPSEPLRRPVVEASPKPQRRLWRTIFALAAIASAGTLAAVSFGEAAAAGGRTASPSSVPGALNQERFVPFALVARDEVAPNAFVLTLRLPSTVSTAAAEATRAAVARARRHGLWSVEVRQPQLQIARDYTPLPVLVADANDDDDVDCIRLFVRTVPGGEMSHYLARQRVGATVDLRGPRLSFDLGARVGVGMGTGASAAARHVVLLAGGTGIATALQAADAVLQSTRPAGGTTTVAILWANRLPHDSAGLADGSGRGRALPLPDSNPIVRDLCALQQRHGADRVRLQCFVDAEQTFVTDAVVRASLQDQGLAASTAWQSLWRMVWPQRSDQPTTAGTEPKRCWYHTAAVLEGLEADPPRDAAHAAHAECTCSAADGALPGKNLVLVSGPDGFVAALAGPKTWARGKERQGPVGGVLGRIRAENPQAFDQWQVLKL